MYNSISGSKVTVNRIDVQGTYVNLYKMLKVRKILVTYRTLQERPGGPEHVKSGFPAARS